LEDAVERCPKRSQTEIFRRVLRDAAHTGGRESYWIRRELEFLSAFAFIGGAYEILDASSSLHPQGQQAE
jgi:hypothetical protein